jgi:hypothetical protein
MCYYVTLGNARIMYSKPQWEHVPVLITPLKNVITSRSWRDSGDRILQHCHSSECLQHSADLECVQ